jgi:diguanylate cyclase (GGDEF)-like protein/PAS domain S-box-containing protein
MLDGPTHEELYEDAPCGYVSLGPDGAIIRANRTFLRSLGLSAEEVVGHRRLRDLMTPGSRLYAESHWGPRLELAGALREMPLELVRADGSRLSVLLNATRVAGRAGGEPEIHASLFDATDRRRYEQELIASRDHERTLRERLERLQRLSAALADAVDVERVSEAMLESISAVVRPESCTILDGEDVIAERAVRFPSPTPGAPIELPLRAGQQVLGTLRLVLDAQRALTDDEQAFLESAAAAGAGALRRAQLFAQTRHAALHDPLTGVANRVMLRERLAHQSARARRTGDRFVVALLGLDGFKALNDVRGHATGDEVLRAVAQRLTAAVRETDLVARLSGDEFVVVCSADGFDGDGDIVATRLAGVLAEPVRVGRSDIHLRASVGVVVAGAGDDVDGILGDADAAMIVAKRAPGESIMRFDASMRERSRERAQIEAELRRALRNDELRVHYQPIVCGVDYSLAGMEALVRWEHPQLGSISPATFVPVAEASGLIGPIGRFVLRAATSQLAAWRAAGLVDDDVSVTVNLSPHQLADPDLVADVASALAGARLQRVPRTLGLELTESMLMQSADSSAQRLTELSDLGVRLLLDDFGTGSSSLARLRRFPVDTLKIDRAFVTGLGEDAEDEAIVAAIVAMAGALSMEVVAEGVETFEQAEWLRGVGAGKLQGFLFSRPLPPDRMFELLVGLRRGEPLHAAGARVRV